MGRGSKKPKRAKSSGKTSFKRKIHNKYLNKNIPCEEIKKNWDFKKTLKQNFTKLGLVYDPNNPNKKEEAEAPIEFADVPVSTEPKRGKYFMTEDDIEYVKPLIKKYKDDYKKMFMDIKLNYNQWTAKKLETMITRYYNYMKRLEDEKKIEEEE